MLGKGWLLDDMKYHSDTKHTFVKIIMIRKYLGLEIQNNMHTNNINY